MDKVFTPTPAYNKAVDVANELDYQETWFFIKHLQAQLAAKSYAKAKSQGETNEKK